MAVKTDLGEIGNGTRARRRAGSPVRPAFSAEDGFRSLLADSDHGILLLDPAGRVAAINPAALRLLSVSSAQARGRPALDLVRTVVAGDDPLESAFRSAHTERDAVLLTRDGGEVPVNMRSDRIGSPPWVLLVLRDLTQLRRMQQELRRNERLATLGQLSAGVAHEIRNPLAGIGTSAQVLLRRFEPRDERARFVQVILEEVARLDRIVTSLLQYARPRAPELSARPLEGCIHRVLELSADAIQSAGIQVEVDVSPRLGPVFIDADLVTQVLLNVTRNSIQAMPSGGRLRYEVRRVRRRRPPRGPGRRTTDRSARGGGAAGWTYYQQVRVIDTGVGMSRGVVAKLFDPFFSTKPQGTGLGLCISQTIMQEHGGSIEVASREGHGTTVMISLPVEKRHGERRESSSDARRTHAADR
jgi:two-component system sensor histidine kinase HydH